MTAVAVIFLSNGVLLFLLGLPLAFRKVPMNHLYGFRVQEAFESEQRWYDINAHGGRQMATWSWLIIVTGAIGFFIHQPGYFLIYTFASIPITLVAIWRAVVLPVHQLARGRTTHTSNPPRHHVREQKRIHE